MVLSSFATHGWYSVPLHVQDELISDVVLSLDKIFRDSKYEKERSRFRHFLKTIIDRRVVDYMRKYYASNTDKQVSIEVLENTANGHQNSAFPDANSALDAGEELAFRRAAILDCYESIRYKFDPQYCLAFEMVKFEGKKVSEAVEALGIDSATISSAIYRITKALRALVFETLKEEGSDA